MDSEVIASLCGIVVKAIQKAGIWQDEAALVTPPALKRSFVFQINLRIRVVSHWPYRIATPWISNCTTTGLCGGLMNPQSSGPVRSGQAQGGVAFSPR